MFRRPLRHDESGQALAIVLAVAALLVLIPVAVQGLATSQAPASTNAVLQQQALQAARAGLSDYINHLTAKPGYLNYCSTGAFSCQSGQSDDSQNPAFATSASSSAWATVQGASSISNEAFSYLVDTHALTLQCDDSLQSFPIYVTGRAGSDGHDVYQELEVDLSVALAGFGCETPDGGSYSSCSNGGYTFSVPAGASYAVVSIYGAQGGGLGSSAGGGGDGYEIYDAYVPAVAGETWNVSVGEAGGGGQFEVLDVGYGLGGRSCLGSMQIAGGRSGGALLGLLTDNGGGGGGATGICVEGSGGSTCSSSSSACTWSSGAFSQTPCVLAVASGGGGDGGDCALLCSNDEGGTGGDNATTTPAGNGANGGGVDGGSGGSVGGSSSTQGQTGGSTLLAADSGYGGGGGGGFPDGGGDGGAGGLCIILVCTLGPGGGGGAGSAAPTPPKPYSTCPSAMLGWVSSYPAPGGSGANGVASITFYSGGGTMCSGTPIYTASIAAQDIQPVPTGTT